MNPSEPTNIGLSATTHRKLRELKDLGYVREMADAYRLGISLALAHGVIPPKISEPTTVFGVSTIDPDQTIKSAIEALMGDHLEGQPVYKLAERLADWGVAELHSQTERGEMDLVSLLEEIERRTLS